MWNDWPTRDLFGLPIRALTMDQVMSIVAERIDTQERLLIGVVNAAKVVNMQRDLMRTASRSNKVGHSGFGSAR